MCDNLKEKLELIFQKLDITHDLKIKKDQILNHELFDKQKIDEIIKLNQDTCCLIEFEESDSLNCLFEKKLYFVRSTSVYLTSLHVQQLLKNRKSVTFKLDEFENYQNEIFNLMMKDKEITLVIECFKNSEKMINLSQFETFNVIIIGSKNNLQCQCQNDDYMGERLF